MSCSPAGLVLQEVKSVPSAAKIRLVDNIEAHIRALSTSVLLSFEAEARVLTPDSVRATGKSDPVNITLINTVEQGFPTTRHQTPSPICSFCFAQNYRTAGVAWFEASHPRPTSDRCFTMPPCCSSGCLRHMGAGQSISVLARNESKHQGLSQCVPHLYNYSPKPAKRTFNANTNSWMAIPAHMYGFVCCLPTLLLGTCWYVQWLAAPLPLEARAGQLIHADWYQLLYFQQLWSPWWAQ